MFTINVHDGDPEERILLWSLGLETVGERNVPARAVMLVGRGERRGPQLEGEDITSQRLLEMFTMLGRSCSCTTDGMWLSGPSLPLEWSEEIEALVRVELGFDPRNPAALGAIRGVLDGLDGAAAPGALADPALGYTETLFEADMGVGLDPREGPSELDVATRTVSSIDARTGPVAEASVAEESGRLADRAPSAEGSISSPGESIAPSRAGHGALLALTGLALLVLAAVTVVVLRGRAA